MVLNPGPEPFLLPSSDVPTDMGNGTRPRCFALLRISVAAIRHRLAQTGTVYFEIYTGIVAELVYQNVQASAPDALQAPPTNCVLQRSLHTVVYPAAQTSSGQGSGSTAKNIRAFNMPSGASLLVQTQVT